jgi:hypothetical protein
VWEHGIVGLIPFDEASRRLRVSGQSYLGVREIPIARIVGSVDRSADFDRDFTPRRGLSRSRLASLRSAFREGGMPAIEVFEVGGAYFIEDGHHRVALARERRADYIASATTCATAAGRCPTEAPETRVSRRRARAPRAASARCASPR